MSVTAAVRDALRDFRRTWPQLLVTDLLAKSFTLLIVAPTVGLLVELFLLRTDDGALSDAEIATFLFHPLGMAALLIVASISLGVVFAEVGTLMVIGFGAVENRRVTYLDAVRYVSRRAPALVRVAGEVIVRWTLVAVPFAAAIGGVYLLLLGRYDINFYLTDRPPEFHLAVWLAGALVVGLAIVLLRKLADWTLALPVILFEGRGGKEALRESARKTASHGSKIAAGLAGWWLATLALSWLVTLVVATVGRALVPGVGGNVVVMGLGLAGALVVAVLANFAVSFVATSLFPLLVVRLYRSLSGPGELVPTIAERGTLDAAGRVALRVPRKWVVAAAGASLILVVGGGYVVSRRLSEEQRTLIIAHRGASGAAPENTIAAFERAIRDGADFIELDVQENSDDTVVVAHDRDLMKVGGAPLEVWRATDDDLRTIDIGNRYGPEFGDQRVPTLREVLDLARGKIGVLIELKYYGHDRMLESRVAELVEETRMASDVMVMSLDLRGVRKSAAIRPDWPHGLLSSVSVGDLTRLRVDFLALNAVAATRSTILRAHGRGMQVYVWTINDPVQMSVMISRGADGIITDEPALAVRVLDVREQLSPIGRLIVWIAGETGFLRGPGEVSDEGDA